MPHEPQSRFKQIEAEGVKPDWPPNPAPIFFVWLMELGPIEASGGGRSPIRWSEITEWERNTGNALQPWQRKLLRRLSNDYLIELVAAEDPSRPSPWSVAPPVEAAVSNEIALRAMLGMPI